MSPVRSPRHWWQEDFRGHLRFLALALFVCFAVAAGMAALAQTAEWRLPLFSLIFVPLTAFVLFINSK